MLSHSISTFRPGQPEALREIQTAAIWGAIEAALTVSPGATTREIASSIGMTPSGALARLNELREIGEVRFAAPRQGSKLRTWEMGAENSFVRAEQMKPTVVKAEQLGIFSRDPLVAALFGAGLAQCVSCEQPQGVPHAEGCAFDGLNIDAIHQRGKS